MKLDFSSVYIRVFFFLLFFFVTIFFNSNLSPHPPLFHRLVLPTSWLCPSGFHFHRRVVLVTPDTPPLPPVTVRSQQGQTACWVSRWFHSSFPRASDDGCPSPQVRSLCLSTIPDRHSSSSHRLCLRPGEDGLLLGSVHAGPPLLPAAGERLLFFFSLLLLLTHMMMRRKQMSSHNTRRTVLESSINCTAGKKITSSTPVTADNNGNKHTLRTGLSRNVRSGAVIVRSLDVYETISWKITFISFIFRWFQSIRSRCYSDMLLWWVSVPHWLLSVWKQQHLKVDQWNWS